MVYSRNAFRLVYLFLNPRATSAQCKTGVLARQLPKYGEMDRTQITGEDARFTFSHRLVFSVTVH